MCPLLKHFSFLWSPVSAQPADKVIKPLESHFTKEQTGILTANPVLADNQDFARRIEFGVSTI